MLLILQIPILEFFWVQIDGAAEHFEALLKNLIHIHDGLSLVERSEEEIQIELLLTRHKWSSIEPLFCSISDGIEFYWVQRKDLFVPFDEDLEVRIFI